MEMVKRALEEGGDLRAVNERDQSTCLHGGQIPPVMAIIVGLQKPCRAILPFHHPRLDLID
jgi:hypothetical protein